MAIFSKLHLPIRLRAQMLGHALLLMALNSNAADQDLRELQRLVNHDPVKVYEEAANTLRQAQSNGDETTQLKMLRIQNLALSYLGMFPNEPFFQTFVDDALNRTQKLDDKQTRCEFLAKWAKQLVSRESSKGISIFNEALAFAERHKLNSCLAMIHLDMGEGFLTKGRSSEAIAALSKAYTLYETQGDNAGMSASLRNIAELFGGSEANAEDQAKAAEYFNRALALIDADVYRHDASSIYLAIALTQYHRQRHTETRQFLDKAIAIAKKMKHHPVAHIAEFYLAILAKDEKRYQEALARLDQMLPSWQLHNIPQRFLVDGLLTRAELLAQLQRAKESLRALADAKAALPQQADAYNYKLYADYYTRAAKIYGQLKEYEKAFKEMEALQEFNRRLAQEANTKLADELKVRFEVNLKETENALLRAQEARRFALLLALALGLMLLVGIAFYLRKRAAAAKREAVHHLALAAAESSANRAKSAFLANMSHELRSPLNAMLGFTRLLQRHPGLPSDARESVEIVLKSGEHLYALINEVLDISRIEAGRSQLQEKNFDLNELVDELAEMFALTARNKGLQLVIDCATDVPRYVCADAVKLRQVLVNLMSNALKFTRSGGITLRIKLSGNTPPSIAEKCLLSFAVIDTGVGIAAEELRQLGGVFVQAEAGRQASEGTGLGLAISRSFVQLMGGELQLYSEPGQGTTVSFDLPMQIIDATSLTARIDKTRRVIGLAPNQPHYRILAVDDQPEGRRLLNLLLTPLGFHIREAANGEEALNIWATWEPQLIFMDMRMPVMDGHETTRRIKATEKGKTTVIIALTASSFDTDRERILAAGCDDFLRKPFREIILFEMLHKYLGVEFVYADEAQAAVATPLDAAQLAALPSELREQLFAAVATLDVRAIEQAIEVIRQHHPTLAQTLTALAKNFEYRPIIDLFQNSESSHDAAGESTSLKTAQN